MPTNNLLWRLGRLLDERTEWDDGAEIAAALDVTRSSLSAWLTHLEFHRALRSRQGQITADRDRLRSILTAHRLADLRPEPSYAVEAEPAAVHDTLADADIPHVFSMFTAANQWAFYEPAGEIHVYLDRRSLPALRRLVPATTHRRSAVTLQPYTETVDRIRAVDRGGLPVTDRFQTVIDLRAHPTGGAHAAFLDEHVLKRRRPAP